MEGSEHVRVVETSGRTAVGHWYDRCLHHSNAQCRTYLRTRFARTTRYNTTHQLFQGEYRYSTTGRRRVGGAEIHAPEGRRDVAEAGFRGRR
jgi:hypothetical protein